MVRSRMPLRSLLCLFGALPMLTSEPQTGNGERLSDLPVTDPYVQKALASAVEQYNVNRADSANYFKVLRLVKAQFLVLNVYFVVPSSVCCAK